MVMYHTPTPDGAKAELRLRLEDIDRWMGRRGGSLKDLQPTLPTLRLLIEFPTGERG